MITPNDSIEFDGVSILARRLAFLLPVYSSVPDRELHDYDVVFFSAFRQGLD
jgi:hypothetical protein